MLYWIVGIYVKIFNCMQKVSSDLFKIIIYKMSLEIIFNICIKRIWHLMVYKQ